MDFRAMGKFTDMRLSGTFFGNGAWIANLRGSDAPGQNFGGRFSDPIVRRSTRYMLGKAPTCNSRCG